MNTRAVRQGLTLVELLGVIAIIIVVSALAIPGVRILTGDLRVREGARDLQAFLQQVLADAKLNGGAGIWIERDAVAPNTGLAVYRVRRPPSYNGDHSTLSACTLINDPTGAITGTAGTFAEFNLVFNSSVQALVDNWLDPTRSVARPQIQFNYVGRVYEITAGAVNGGVYRVQLVPLAHQTGGMPVGSFANQKFTIIPPPIKISTRAMVMPKETYIDLGLSGFVPIDTDNDGLANVDGVELAVNSIDTTPGPVIVLFGRDGSIERVISKRLMPGGFSAGQTLSLFVVQDLRNQTAVFNEPLDVTSFPTLGSATNYYANLVNPSNLWISLGRNGQVTLSENSDVTDRGSDAVGDVVRAARSIALQQDQMQNN